MTELHAYELREGLRRGDWSARELVQQTLKRIAQLDSSPRLDSKKAAQPNPELSNGSSAATGAGQRQPDSAHQAPPLGAFIEVRAELALREADAVDRLVATTPIGKRNALPPLLGLPTAHKDLLQVRGFTTTHGSAALPHLIAEQDDPVARVIRDAGAICVGKTQVPEFGIAGYSENLIAPPARNPFDPSLTAGGSSGGTATAIAAGMIPAAIGSDAGGSIRIPSGACGLIGLKPGRGVVPADALNGEVDDIGAPRMAVSGPMARTARDAALFYDALLGRPDEPALHAIDRANEVTGLRIGVSLDSPFEGQIPIQFDEAALASLDEAVRRLEHQGHHPEHASINYGTSYPEAFTTVWTQSLTRIPLNRESKAEAKLGELAQWFLASARAATPKQVEACVVSLHNFARNAAAQWSAFDIVLTPALAFTPPETGAFWALGPEGDYRLQCEWAPQTSMVNVAGLPAITVPICTDADGLPRGVQLIGRAGSEVQLLQLAAQLLGE